jgi:protein TonB
LEIPPVKKEDRKEYTAPPVVSTAPPVVTSPNWTRKPSGDDYARFYPERAQRLEKEGVVLIKCVVTTKGALVNCQVLSEDPADFGFGEASKKIASLWKMRPQTVNGEPVEASWQTRIKWQLPR